MRHHSTWIPPKNLLFQSTHPGWGATLDMRPYGAHLKDFNPRTPGGVRLTGLLGDDNTTRFQSTHPGWGATLGMYVLKLILYDFNPRTPGGVRPAVIVLRVIGRDYFNPRTPGGVRRCNPFILALKEVFQSTHPGWGATLAIAGYVQIDNISIHAPRVGCDSKSA